MSINYNDVNPSTVIFNGTELSKVNVVKGTSAPVTVWEKASGELTIVVLLRTGIELMLNKTNYPNGYNANGVIYNNDDDGNWEVGFTMLDEFDTSSGETIYANQVRFTSPVALNVCCVGGGGGGTYSHVNTSSFTYGGGGGAGGWIETSNCNANTSTTYIASVGAGGVAGTGAEQANKIETSVFAGAGGNSSFSGGSFSLSAKGGAAGTRGTTKATCINTAGQGGDGSGAQGVGGAGGYAKTEKQNAKRGGDGLIPFGGTTSTSVITYKVGAGGGGGGCTYITSQTASYVATNGAGGVTGGGTGGTSLNRGDSATAYGAGGGGGSSYCAYTGNATKQARNGGAGYQGIVIIRNAR